VSNKGENVAARQLSNFPRPLLADLITGRWLPIVGAGFSRNAVLPDGAPLPMWGELGNLISQDLQDYSSTGPIDAISAFEHEFGRPKLIERLSELLRVDVARPSVVHKAFCSLPFDLVCTTNFDFLLEHQYQLIPRHCTPLIDEDQLSIGLKDTGTALLKLHGDLNHTTRLVATESDYDCFLDRFPLLATFVANLLITRTAVLIGYSLDDPDFRQIWQVVGERLGRSRRVAYVILVGAKPSDIARFERRGVKVINLTGSRSKYAEALTEAFTELWDYWQERLIPASRVREEEPLQELSLPRDANTRLCFFAIPLSLQPFYRERVFPIARDAGLVPVTADDVVTPGDNIVAKLDALLERALLVVVDAATPATLSELQMAIVRLGPARVLLVSQRGGHRPTDLEGLRTVERPDITEVDPVEFLTALQSWFQQAAHLHLATFMAEPERLLVAGENRAAVISAITLLETTLREQLEQPTMPAIRPMPLRRMLNLAAEHELLPAERIPAIMEWLHIRNQLVHSRQAISRRDAQQIVSGVLKIVKGSGGRFGA
jgi:hypothetical protein